METTTCKLRSSEGKTSRLHNCRSEFVYARASCCIRVDNLPHGVTCVLNAKLCIEMKGRHIFVLRIMRDIFKMHWTSSSHTSSLLTVETQSDVVLSRMRLFNIQLSIVWMKVVHVRTPKSTVIGALQHHSPHDNQRALGVYNKYEKSNTVGMQLVGVISRRENNSRIKPHIKLCYVY